MDFRVGVIGAGNHGTRYLRHAMKDVPGMTATALCRRDKEAGARLATELGLRYHRDPESLLADPEVDGVIIATPPSVHAVQAAAVIAANRPLLLEKPLTATLGEAEDLARLADRSGAPVMVAQTLRWNPVIRMVSELWPQLGRVELVRVAQRLQPTELGWQHDRSDPSGGSVLITGVHLFDTVRHLTGREFIEVDSRQERIMNEAVEDYFLAAGRLDDGCRVSMEVSKYTHSRACWLEAVGRDGQLWADYLTGGIILRIGSEERRLDVSASAPTLPLVLADWLASVRDGSPPPVSVADGVAAVRVADACYRSAAAGGPVSVA